ncbi:MFS transporter [Nocardia asteroides]|uniref:MFS transporter n=1 Tax=Nocardia asteroides TaxID=1824 RepID=UPI001E561721|nr:MFS transporter [Nocardia asteroides]UGT62700.1 MFS transporter [Nocardia asteroides]
MIVTCQLMVAVDSNVVNIALPEIQSGLGMSALALAWVFSAYSLAYGGLLLLGGRAGDILGRRRMFIWGLSLVVAASVLGGIAPNEAVLIAARALQGAGFAFAGPAALSMIAATFADGPERTRALGVFSMVTGFGITLGLVLGGVLTTLSWRLVFFINVPIGLVTILLAARYLTETERHRGRFDLLGAIVSTLGMVGIVYGLTNGANGWTDPATLAPILTGLALVALFVRIERRAAQPIMPLRLLHDPVRAGAYLTFVLLMASMAGTYILLSLYLQDALGFGPLQAGLAFLPMAAVQFAVAKTAPALIARFGRGPMLLTGVLLMMLEAVWLTTTSESSNYVTGVLGPFVLLGAGLSLAFVTLNLTVLGGLEPRDMGAASGLLQATQQIGLSLGVAVLTTLYQSAGDQHPNGAAGSREVLAHGLSTAVLAAVGFTGAALLIGLFVARRTPKTAAAR